MKRKENSGKVSRLSTIAVIAIVFGLIMAPMTAFAAAPGNDDFGSATPIVARPFTNAISTSGATTAADDPLCWANGASVWYSFIPTENMRINANTFGSSYDTTLSVYTGSRGALTQIACNDDSGEGTQSQVIFDAIAGQPVFFMVGSFGSGGDLVFSVPSPLTIDSSINPTGSVERSTGDAKISGTVTCSQATLAYISGELSQKAGRINVINGYYNIRVMCDGVTPWSTTVGGNNGLFKAGQVDATALTIAEDLGFPVFDSASAVVILKGGPP